MRKKNWFFGIMAACILGAVLTACSSQAANKPAAGDTAKEGDTAKAGDAPGGATAGADDKAVSLTLGDTWAETHPMQGPWTRYLKSRWRKNPAVPSPSIFPITGFWAMKPIFGAVCVPEPLIWQWSARS